MAATVRLHSPYYHHLLYTFSKGKLMLYCLSMPQKRVCTLYN